MDANKQGRFSQARGWLRAFTLLLALSACGDDEAGEHTPDAQPLHDAAIDAGMDADIAPDASAMDAGGDARDATPEPRDGQDQEMDALATVDSDVADAPNLDDAANDAATDASEGTDAASGNAFPAAVVDYQVRCLDCEPVAADYPARHLNVRHGEQDFSVECNVEDHLGTQLAAFEIRHTDSSAHVTDFALSVEFARLSGDSGIGALCQVTVKEGAASYSESCGDEAPNVNRRCQVLLELDGDTVSGTLRCLEMRHVLSVDYERYLVAPGTQDEPVEVRIEGCALPDDDAGTL